ncbi:hypothetical protein D9M69_125690 [compost metagenome]
MEVSGGLSRKAGVIAEGASRQGRRTHFFGQSSPGSTGRRPLLRGMEYPQDPDGGGIHGVHDQVVGRHDHLARARDAAGSVELGVFRQPCRFRFEVVLQALGRIRILIRDVVNDGEKIGPGPPRRWRTMPECDLYLT